MIDPFKTTGILGAKHFDTDDIVKTSMISQIEQLRAENERLREALQPFASMAGWLSGSEIDPDDLTPLWDGNDLPTLGDLRAARKALGETDN